MIQEPIRWLIDQDLPQVSEETPDTMHLSECGRDVLKEALKEDRAVGTTNEYLLDSKTIPFNCPPLVIVNGGFLTPEALLRNLRHFEFCLLHDEATTPLTGQRFFIDVDRAIYRWRPNGTLQEMEAWKSPNVTVALAPDAPT